MTPLERLLIRQIKASGPLRFADYMRLALLHPRHGYYTKSITFGEKGDFITAPDISQMFGEVIGLWCAQRWQTMGRPDPFALVEPGGGRGTLMRDLLRAGDSVPGFTKAARIFFIEAAKRRKTEQRKTVKSARFVSNIGSLPALPALFVSNEFFDALPVHQFVWRKGRFWERGVGLDPTGAALADQILPPSPVIALRDERLEQPNKDGAVVEVNPDACQFATDMARHLHSNGGAALTFDYGHSNPGFGDTLQAVRNHQLVTVLDRPGETDITAHVDFAALNNRARAAGLTVFGPKGQGDFLMQNGIGLRAKALASGAAPGMQQDILIRLKRLTAPDQMGTLFKVVAWQSGDLDAPPGFT